MCVTSHNLIVRTLKIQLFIPPLRLLNYHLLPSIQSELFNFLLKWITKNKFIRNQLASGQSTFHNCPEPPPKLLKICNVHKFKINNRNIFTISPKNKDASDKHIIYLHGGAYVQSFLTFHWSFMAKLVKELNCTITAPDYPLAPAYTYKESFEMLTTLYSKLLTTAGHHHFIFMGDSSGGGFALAFAQEIRNTRLRQPDQIILLSPWLDVTLKNPLIEEINAIQPFLGIDALREVGKIYAGDTSPDYYFLSPINGSLEGLGKISVFIGTKDILVADARKLKLIAESNKIAINYYEYEEMVHVWMLLNLPESKKAFQQIVGLIADANWQREPAPTSKRPE